MLQVNDVTRLYLGIQGENAARTITIDVNPWLVAFPGGSVTIWHKRNGDATPSATGAVFDSDAGTISWTPTSTDTYVSGEGVAEIRLTVGSVIKKSRAVITGVSPAVTLAGTTLGSDWQSYINAVDSLRSQAETAKEAAEAAKEDVEELIDEAVESITEAVEQVIEEVEDDIFEARDDAEDAAEDAEAARDAAQTAQTAAENAAAKYPRADPDTETWWIWNVLENRWVNTGISCSGIVGPTGATGQIGPQGIPGRDGRDAVIIQIGAVEYAFQIDGNGHLVLNYGGEDAPNFYITSQGHLIYEF